MAGMEISERDWDMSGWPPEEIVVEGIVMALEGCGRDESPVSVLLADGSPGGTPLRVLGVRRVGGARPASWQAQIVVELQDAARPGPTVPAQAAREYPRLDGCACAVVMPGAHKPPCQWAN